MNRTTITAVAFLAVVGVAILVYNHIRGKDARIRELEDVSKSLRYACMDGHLKGEASNSAVIVFRPSCLKIGVWNGPPAD